MNSQHFDFFFPSIVLTDHTRHSFLTFTDWSFSERVQSNIFFSTKTSVETFKFKISIKKEVHEKQMVGLMDFYLFCFLILSSGIWSQGGKIGLKTDFIMAAKIFHPHRRMSKYQTAFLGDWEDFTSQPSIGLTSRSVHGPVSLDLSLICLTKQRLIIWILKIQIGSHVIRIFKLWMIKNS